MKLFNNVYMPILFDSHEGWSHPATIPTDFVMTSRFRSEIEKPDENIEQTLSILMEGFFETLELTPHSPTVCFLENWPRVIVQYPAISSHRIDSMDELHKHLRNIRNSLCCFGDAI